MADAPKIDREFADLCPPLTPEERNLLEASIESDGCRDSLVVWKEKGLLLDGHNRIDICGTLGKNYRTKEISLPDRGAAIEWIIVNQLGRRNVSDEQKSYLRGKRYQHEKAKHGGDRKSSGQNGHLERTAEKIAAETNVDEKTIRRDAQFAQAVAALKEAKNKLGLYSVAAAILADHHCTHDGASRLLIQTREFIPAFSFVLQHGGKPE